MPVLLDMGANVNIITPECMVALGLQMGPLTDLREGGVTINQPFNYEGRLIAYVIMSVQIKGISGYNEDQVTLMAHSSAKFAHHVPIILGTPTMDWAIKTLKESKIDKLATPWACVRKSTLLRAATTRVTAVPEAPKAAQWGHRKHSSHKVRCAASHIQPENLTPMLNKDARSHWLGRDNVGYATIKGK